MCVKNKTAKLIVVGLLCAGTVHPQRRCTNLAPLALNSEPVIVSAGAQTRSGKEAPGQKMLLVADNQEHVLTGVQLFSMGLLSEVFLSSTAMRPLLAHVGGRLVLSEALRFGKREGVGTVLHLGDATNISCRDELTSVFETLNKEAVDDHGNPIWFMAPGNHDGMLAGNLTGYQPALNYQLTEKEVNDFYSERRSNSAISKQKAWVGACLSLKNWRYQRDSFAPLAANQRISNKRDKDMLSRGILTRGDAIRLYVETLRKREKDSVVTEWEEEPIDVEGTNVICDVKEIKLRSHSYTAVASICRLTELKNDPNNWVGPFASHIVQKLEIGGIPIILLDTSDYKNPSRTQVPFRGRLTDRQMVHANYLMFGKKQKDALDEKKRDEFIIAGHHPIPDFPPADKRWIAERTSRYISAHVHTSTKLISHKWNDKLRVEELNVASTLDDPQQVVIAKMNPPATMTFRVVESGDSRTGTPGLLQTCATQKKYWKLPSKFYQGYWRGIYGDRLRESLVEANKLAPHSALRIPEGRSQEDWRQLEEVLEAINTSEGDTRTFWACQSVYASQANSGDQSLFEFLKPAWTWVKRTFRPSPYRQCDAATGQWFLFSPP